MVPGAFASEEFPRILIAPLEKNFDSNQYNVIATTVYDTMLLSLRLLGEYEVLTIKEGQELDFSDRDAVSAYASENFIDNVVTGSISVNDSGRIDFSLQLYESESDFLKTGIQSSAANVLEVFDASDALITDLIAQFNDRHIAFGSMAFTNLGYQGEYNIFLGNTFLGKSIEKADRVLTGEYKLIITQFRFNQLKVLESHTINILENEEFELTFSLPHLLPEEEESLQSRYDDLTLLFEQKDDDNPSPEILKNALLEMDDLPGMEGLEPFITKFKEREALWNLQREWWDMEEFPLQYPPHDFIYGPRLFNDDSPWQSPEIKEAALMNGMLYCHILSLQASLLLFDDDLDAGMALYDLILRTASQFGSESAFGFMGEYEQLTEILEHPKRRDRWKEKSIGRLVETRAELAIELNQEDRVTTVLVFMDAEDTKAKVNGRRRKFPYLDSKHRQDELTLTLLRKKEENIELEFPVLGVNTMIIIPEDNPEFMRELKSKRDFQQYSAYFGIGGGSWIGVRGQYRFAWGRLGISSGVEFATYFLEGDALLVLHVPLQLDFFPIMRPLWEMSIGLCGDLLTLTPDGIDNDLSLGGINLGLVLKREVLDFYLDNRIYFQTFGDGEQQFLYSPQIGIRL